MTNVRNHKKHKRLQLTDICLPGRLYEAFVTFLYLFGHKVFMVR